MHGIPCLRSQGMLTITYNPLIFKRQMKTRNYSDIDHLLLNIDTGLRTLFGTRHTTGRPNPADLLKDDQIPIKDADLPAHDRELAGRLMRINHAGEVAAQGLYQGQALTAALPTVRHQMERAAAEENDHLDWCRRRSHEMGARTSYLDPMWYVGSVLIGALAGKAGDKWSLGFVAETEKQVVKHLDDHLLRIPKSDRKTRAILQQMKQDETHHATNAIESGGQALPAPIKAGMSLVAKIMTKSSYWV